MVKSHQWVYCCGASDCDKVILRKLHGVSSHLTWKTLPGKKNYRRSLQDFKQKKHEARMMQSGCHNPMPRGHIVPRKFALSHRKFQLISTHLLLLRVNWVKLSDIRYLSLQKINSCDKKNFLLLFVTSNSISVMI